MELETGRTEERRREWCWRSARSRATAALFCTARKLLRPLLEIQLCEDHCWFYADAAVRRALSKRNPNTAQLRKGVKPTQTPAASEWKMFEQEVAPGHFWAKEDDISQVMAWMLQNRINPKVILKDETRIRTLIVHLGREACYVHSLPETSADLQKWLANLNIGLEYHGEGLPALSLKVLQCLVKKSRERVTLTGEQKAEILDSVRFKRSP